MDASTAARHLGTKKPVTASMLALALGSITVVVIGALVLLNAIA